MSNQALMIKDDMSMMDLGNVLAKSGYFQDARDAAQAVVKVLAGREMGFGPVASMTGINIIKGRVSMGANLIAAAVKRSARYDYRVKVMTADECTIEFLERVDGKRELIGVSTFTIADARKALTQNIDKFPRNMLFARAMSNGAKWFCADVFGGPIYTPDELGAIVNEEGEVIDQPAIITRTEAQQSDAIPHFESLPAGVIPQAESKPDNTSDVKVKQASIKTPKFPAMIVQLQDATPYYNDAKTGKANNFHVLKSAAKIGYAEITSENIDQVLVDLIQHAKDNTAEVPAE